MDITTPSPEEAELSLDGHHYEEGMNLLVSLLNLADDAVIVRDPANRIVFWNLGAQRLYGWNAEEAMGRVTHDLFQTQFPESRDALDRFLATGEQWEGELVQTRKDGSQVIVESRQSLRRNTHGEILAILEVNRDITERKQREQEHLEYYRTIVRTANEGIWLIDTQARTLFINERMAEMLGYLVEELIGHAVPEFVFAEDLAAAGERIGSNLAGHFEQFDFRFRRKDGSPLAVLACTSPVRDGRGEINGVLGMFSEVGERQQLEQARRELAALVESAAIPIIGKTREGIITSWNNAAERMYGYSAQEAVDQPITLLYPPERQDEFTRVMERINRGEQVDLYETVRRRKDGTLLPVSITVSPLYDGGGQISGASDIAHDITERKRIETHEQFLAEVSRELSSTLDYQETLANISRLVVPQLADWFVVDVIDAEGRFELVEIAHKDPAQVAWARTLREQNPVDPEAPTGLPKIVRTGQSELYAHISDEMLDAGASSEEELALAKQIGYSSVMLVPLVGRGRIIGVVTFVATESGKHFDERDLALAEEVGRRAGMALENARLYHEVQQSRDQLQIILQGVADGIVVYASESHMLYANEAAAHMNDYASVQQFLSKPLLELVGRYEFIDEEGEPFLYDQAPHRRVFAGEPEAEAVIGYREVGADQPERWALVTSRPVLSESGEVALVVSILHDITERMLLEQRKDEFISMTSHELKTPVTSLKGFTNILQRRLAKRGDTQELYFLSRMDAQLDKLTDLISELLDISRIQSGKLALHYGPVDLDALIDDTVETVQVSSSTHALVVEGRTGVQVMGDADRLSQVFVNLFTNAIKYSPGRDTVRVTLSREGEPEQVIVSVQDYGIGIDKEHHEHIFERFYQVTDPEEKTYPGLGIGLYISHEIMERHQGHLWVESRKGEGSTFFVALPVLSPEVQAELE